jgi:hydroxylamine dehydrogenase
MEAKRTQMLTAFLIGTGLTAILAGSAYLVHQHRPRTDLTRSTAEEIRATGKCAECHVHVTKGVLEHFTRSKHHDVGVTCLDCHKPHQGQDGLEHNGFEITRDVTALNCAGCHEDEYRQFAVSRHAGASWGAVHGAKDFSPEQLAMTEKAHPDSANRPPHALVALQGEAAAKSGCESCHSIGKPNADGSFGQCTECHSVHNPSVSLARLPETCGQCHMGPDHSQLEIYNESKHGVLFRAEQHTYNLSRAPKELRVNDMPVPTCSTCHMSGLEGRAVTHNVSERLSYWLFSAISDKRPNFDMARGQMQMICSNCHAFSKVLAVYEAADAVVENTNKRVAEAMNIYEGLKRDGLLTPAPFDEAIDYLIFDLWHYYGRTAKHGAFMGGGDFVQWHGNYEIMHSLIKLQEMEKALRGKK